MWRCVQAGAGRPAGGGSMSGTYVRGVEVVPVWYAELSSCINECLDVLALGKGHGGARDAFHGVGPQSIRELAESDTTLQRFQKGSGHGLASGVADPC